MVLGWGTLALSIALAGTIALITKTAPVRLPGTQPESGSTTPNLRRLVTPW
jgi:hypothetical protein